MGVPASIEVENASTGAQATGNLVLNEIRLVPSCLNTSAGCAGGFPDREVFVFSATGTGAAGTACAGVTFDIVFFNAAINEVRFVRQGGGNVQLGPPGSIGDG